MAVCGDKVCEAKTSACCDSLMPSICGDRDLTFTEGNCTGIVFEGVEDVSVNQGLCIDLTDGVHAYDGNGEEIEYTVEPSEIGCCDVGEHEVTYSAIGKSKKMLPTLCSDTSAIYVANCGMDKKTVERTVTIKAINPPTISGIGVTCIDNETLFNPMSGVSAVDGNGRTVDVDYSGEYALESSGTIASFEANGGTAKSVLVSIEPKQDLHGYDKPWIGGAGKNLLPYPFVSASPLTQNGVTFTARADGSVVVNGTCTSNGTYFWLYGNASAPLLKTLKEGQSYIFSVEGAPTGLNGQTIFYGSPSAVHNAVGGSADKSVRFTVPNMTSYTGNAVVLQAMSGRTFNNVVVKPMLRLASETDATYEPYSNICPISGRTEVETIVSPTTTASDGTTYTTTLGRTVYGGTLDVVSGELVVDRAMVNARDYDWGDITNGGVHYYCRTNPQLKSEGFRDKLSCNMLETVVTPYLNPSADLTITNAYARGMNVNIRYDAIATLSDWNTFIAEHDVEIAWAIEPQTYQLTPTEVDLLLGYNNVWSDGGSVEVTYPMPIPDGAFTYPVDGVYKIDYHAEDNCGNETTSTRTVIVSDDEITCAEASLSVSVTVTPQGTALGDVLDLTYTISNTGGREITNYVLRGEKTSDEFTGAYLGIGETESFEAEYEIVEEDILNGSVTFSVEGSGISDGEHLSASSEVSGSVDAPNPNVRVSIAGHTNADTYVKVNFNVRNTGNVTFSEGTFRVPLTEDVFTIPRLAPGVESLNEVTYECTSADFPLTVTGYATMVAVNGTTITQSGSYTFKLIEVV